MMDRYFSTQAEYKITRLASGQQVAYVRAGVAWCPLYAGYSSPGRDLEKHWSEILEAHGYRRYAPKGVRA